MPKKVLHNEDKAGLKMTKSSLRFAKIKKNIFKLSKKDVIVS